MTKPMTMPARPQPRHTALSSQATSGGGLILCRGTLCGALL